MCLEIRTKRVKFLIKGQVHSETVDDLDITLFDGGKGVVKIRILLGKSIAGIQHVRYLRIGAVTLSGGGGNDKPAIRIRLDDILYFSKLVGACKRASAEFYNLNHTRELLNENTFTNSTIHIFCKYARENVKKLFY